MSTLIAMFLGLVVLAAAIGAKASYVASAELLQSGAAKTTFVMP